MGQNKNTYTPTRMLDWKNNSSLSNFGISFHWWNSEPTSFHNHNFYEIFLITRGEALHKLNCASRRLVQNTLCFIRPEDCHSLSCATVGGCMHINISLVASRLGEICRGLGIDIDDIGAETVLSPIEAGFFIKRAEQMKLLIHTDSKSCFVTASELAAHALAALYRAESAHVIDAPEWFTNLLEKLHSPDCLACSAADVYSLANFSAPVTIEYFKRYTGKTVSEYLRGIKIDNACEALRYTDISVLELSAALGYNSLSHFNRVFSSFTGRTPAAYRKENGRASNSPAKD